MRGLPQRIVMNLGERTITNSITLGTNNRPYTLVKGDTIEILKLNAVYRTAEVKIQDNIETLYYSIIDRISKCKEFPCTKCRSWVPGIECSEGKDYRVCEGQHHKK